MSSKEWRSSTCFIGITSVLIGMLGGFFGVLSGVLLSMAVILDLTKARCTNCERHIPLGSPFSIEYCPYCGKSLE